MADHVEVCAEGLYKDYVDDPGMCPDPKSSQCVTKVVRTRTSQSVDLHRVYPELLDDAPTMWLLGMALGSSRSSPG